MACWLSQETSGAAERLSGVGERSGCSAAGVSYVACGSSGAGAGGAGGRAVVSGPVSKAKGG